jgi:hypothetical protein
MFALSIDAHERHDNMSKTEAEKATEREREEAVQWSSFSVVFMPEQILR